jgi:hypothetical protein
VIHIPFADIVVYELEKIKKEVHVRIHNDRSLCSHRNDETTSPTNSTDSLRVRKKEKKTNDFFFFKIKMNKKKIKKIKKNQIRKMR